MIVMAGGPRVGRRFENSRRGARDVCSEFSAFINGKGQTMTTPASFDFNRRVLLSTLALLPALIGSLRPKSAVAQTDILQSWSDGPAKTSIIDFVARVTTESGPDFVPAEQRIAVFDNDGTLWTEQPFYFQLAFAFDRVKAVAPQHPEWKTTQPFKALLDRDMKALGASGEKG